MFENIGEMVVLFWRTLLAVPVAWRDRGKVLEQFFEIGNASLLMVCILSFFVGGVMALQTGPILVERGLASAVGGVVGISVCKELAPVIMSILIAGRIGSAMAAEIGSMRVYQEIDALRTMNINPIHYLRRPPAARDRRCAAVAGRVRDSGRLDGRNRGFDGELPHRDVFRRLLVRLCATSCSSKTWPMACSRVSFLPSSSVSSPAIRDWSRAADLAALDVP